MKRTQQQNSEPAPQDAGEPWHTYTADKIAEQLGTDLTNGLSANEAAQRLAKSGPNELEATKRRSLVQLFFDQFRSLIVLLLAVATVVSYVLGDRLEAASIVVVLILNALIGFFTEARAEQAIAALKEQTTSTARVVRGGEESQIPSRDLVAGDVIVLAAGDRVPADGRVVESVRLQVQEAALTGESLPINKVAEELADAALPLADRTNMAFMGTAVTDGHGRMLVTATAKGTEIGRIGTLIEEAESEDTPLERKLAQLGRALVLITPVVCLIVAVAGRMRGHGWEEMLKIAISLAIAAVPEGLPAVATVTLAIGVRRMARRNALIRHLAAVETLGATTVICVDKTGTLTRNEMTVAAYAIGARRIDVTGSGYTTEGEFRENDAPLDPLRDHALSVALRIGALCNDAKVDREKNKDEPEITGDPTEAALIVAAEKAGLGVATLHERYERLSDIPFSAETKRMVTVHRMPEGRLMACVKGAPGTIIEASSERLEGDQREAMSAEDREKFLETNGVLAGEALRVLALAYKEAEGETPDDEALASDLIFAGFVGMIDPLRDEAKDAIAKCREAGMRVIMLTGDQPTTAQAIGHQLGLEDEAVHARITPEEKLRIVEDLQKEGEIVAMTGDGVNDAPALKKANIGIAMGIQGTQVAKETSDMIITDDNFASIVGAVEQGRIIYRNIQRFIHYLFSCNLSEILTVFAAVLIGWPLPLVALQILWLNIITDVFPALALALEPGAPDIMKRGPRDPGERIVDMRFTGVIVWQGLLLAFVTLVAFRLGIGWYGAEDIRPAGTMAFMTLALAQTLHAFNTRSRDQSMFGAGLFVNPWLWSAVAVCVALQMAAVFVPFLREVLDTAVPSVRDWLVIAACSFAPLLVVEIVKMVTRARRGSGTHVPAPLAPATSSRPSSS